MDDKGKKTLETGAFVLGGALLIWFVVASSGGGGSSSAPVPTSTSTAAPSDAAVTAGAAEYQSQLGYQSQVLAAGSATQAALINAYSSVVGTENTNATNVALGQQNTDLQEKESQLAASVANYQTEVEGNVALAQNTTQGQVAITEANDTTTQLTQQYEAQAKVALGQAADQLGQVQAFVGGQTATAQANAKTQQNQANDNLFGNLFGDAALAFGL